MLYKPYSFASVICTIKIFIIPSCHSQKKQKNYPVARILFRGCMPGFTGCKPLLYSISTFPQAAVTNRQLGGQCRQGGRIKFTGSSISLLNVRVEVLAHCKIKRGALIYFSLGPYPSIMPQDYTVHDSQAYAGAIKIL